MQSFVVTVVGVTVVVAAVVVVAAAVVVVVVATVVVAVVVVAAAVVDVTVVVVGNVNFVNNICVIVGGLFNPDAVLIVFFPMSSVVEAIGHFPF